MSTMFMLKLALARLTILSLLRSEPSSLLLTESRTTELFGTLPFRILYEILILLARGLVIGDMIAT